MRDYIHVTDLAQAHILALGALDGGSRFYNLGNGEGFTVKEVIDAARQITGKEIRADIGPAGPAILRSWLPPATKFARNSDGCRSSHMSAPSSKVLGDGTKQIQMVTRNNLVNAGWANWCSGVLKVRDFQLSGVGAGPAHTKLIPVIGESCGQ